MKIGIRQNKVLCRISGCRVYKDMRPTSAVDATREITNFIPLTKVLRVQNATKRALTRMAHQAHIAQREPEVVFWEAAR